MLTDQPKTHKLKQNYCFRRVYRRGQYVNSEHLTFYYFARRDTHRYLGVTVPRRFKGGVLRNRIKRQLRALYREREVVIKPGYDFILLGRYRPETVKYAQLIKEFDHILKKTHLTVEQVSD